MQEEIGSKIISTQNLVAVQQHAVNELDFLEDSKSLEHPGHELLPVLRRMEGPLGATSETTLPTQNPRVTDMGSSPLQLPLPEEIHKRKLLHKVIQGDTPKMPRLRRVNTLSNLYIHAQDAHLLRNLAERDALLSNLILNEDVDGPKESSNKGHSDEEEYRTNFEAAPLADATHDTAEDSNLRTFIVDRGLNPILFGNMFESNSLLPSISNEKQHHVGSRGRPESGSEIVITYQRSLRVSEDDPCSIIIPRMLKEYNITDNWLHYRLILIYQTQEKPLGLQERPVPIYNQLKNEGKQPHLMLRKVSDLSGRR